MLKSMRLLLCGVLFATALCTLSAFTTVTPSSQAASHVSSVVAASCPATVQKGDRGSAVKLAQQSVNWWYYHSRFGLWIKLNFPNSLPIKEDGIFGSKTEIAIAHFQYWDYPANLTIDGIVGPKTWHALGHC